MGEPQRLSFSAKGGEMGENDYKENKIEVSLSDVVELAMARQKEEERAKRAAEAKELESVESTPQGEKLTWKVTPEQIARINAGERSALDAFYFDTDNLRRIKYSAYSFMRKKRFLLSVISWEDLVQQVYCDLVTGMTKLKPYDKAISQAIFNSFRYAAVGGLDEIFIPKERK